MANNLGPINEHPSQSCSDFIDKWPLYEEELQKYHWAVTLFESLQRNSAFPNGSPGYIEYISKDTELDYDKRRLQTSSSELEAELQKLASLLLPEIKEFSSKFLRIIYNSDEYSMYTTTDKIPIRFRKIHSAV